MYFKNFRSIRATGNFRDLSKRMMVGSILGKSYMNDPHISNITGKMFNLVTCENEMKWEVTEPQRGKHVYDGADAIVQYAQKHNMKIRGHNLVWHKQIPNWLNSLSKTELRAAMQSRIK